MVLSLIITGAFMVFMSYVEVFGARHYGTPLNDLALPLTTLSKIYGVSYFKIPVALGAMVSFFSLTLSCLNAGSRIIYPMAQHTVFPRHLAVGHRDALIQHHLIPRPQNRFNRPVPGLQPHLLAKPGYRHLTRIVA